MSSKHLFPSLDGLVVKGLRGIISYNPSLSLIESQKVVFDSNHSKNNVAIISGGGAGHEPCWSGYVGKNLLAAAASGDIFASPNTNQVIAAIEAVPSEKGTIMCVGNYTGDALHFGLAAEKMNARGGSPCALILAGDDVSVGRKGNLVGRRGLASQVVTLKILCGAAADGRSFDDCLSLGKAVVAQSVSIAATLDHCHVPGRAEAFQLSADEIELGTGPHNEPGYSKISPIPSAEDFIGRMLKNLLDESDPDRGYVHFEKGDEVILLLSNFGGMSNLEMGAVIDETLEQLEKQYSLRPIRVYNGPVETSLNAPAFSTSLVNLTQAAKNTSFSVEQMLEYLDVKTETAWEGYVGGQKHRRTRQEQIHPAPEEAEREVDSTSDVKVDAKLLKSMIRTACDRVIEREPDLTKWDTIMGDGDCGETLKNGATTMLQALDSLAESGSVVKVLHRTENIVEGRMGGTLGGILGIWFVSLTTALQKEAKAGASGPQMWGKAAVAANKALGQYTPANIGDRTVMDVLIPFANTLAKTASFEKAAHDAGVAANATKKMTPKLGRATYVGVEEGKDLPPDPGAWGVMEAIQGLLQGMSS